MFLEAETTVTLENVVGFITQADDDEMVVMVKAIIDRYSQVFPDWEVMFLSLRKDPELRKEDIEGICNNLQETQKSSLG